MVLTGFARFFCILSLSTSALELVLGEKKVPPGIVLIFEGAIKDTIYPQSLHLSEKKTHVHIEARINWAEEDIPEGTPPGGFIPYLRVVAEVVNQKTGEVKFTDLLPHLNLVDNFHYARNIQLSGNPTDLYKVTFRIIPPDGIELGLHQDWVNSYGYELLEEAEFVFKGIDFSNIVKASRR